MITAPDWVAAVVSLIGTLVAVAVLVWLARDSRRDRRHTQHAKPKRRERVVLVPGGSVIVPIVAKRHVCDPPDPADYPVGSTFVCATCGAGWEKEAGQAFRWLRRPAR